MLMWDINKNILFLWLGGRRIWMLDLRSTGHEFKSCSPRCLVQPWASW